MVARLYGQAGGGEGQRDHGARRLGLRGRVTARAHVSGGMRRRLDLGREPRRCARLLLLDEPTTGLDPGSRIELWDAIRDLVDNGTDVLLTTQYLDEADQLASRIVIVDNGRVIADGSPRAEAEAGRDVVEIQPTGADLPVAPRSEASARRAGLDIATRRVSVSVAAVPNT